MAASEPRRLNLGVRTPATPADQQGSVRPRV